MVRDLRCNRMPDPPDPVVLAEAVLGESLAGRDVAGDPPRAPSRRTGLAMLFASPEFQRR